MFHHSGYPGGLKRQLYADALERKPAEAVRRTVGGMLPKNRLGRQMIKKLKVYAGPDHPHAAQQPAAARDRPRPPGVGAGQDDVDAQAAHPDHRSPQGGRRPRPRRGRAAATITVNRRQFEEYFPSETHRMIITEPLKAATTAETYDIDATIDGGGVSGQAGALRLGIARALVELDPELRTSLKRPAS